MNNRLAKKGMSEVFKIALAVIASLLILMVMGGFAQVLNKPDTAAEGLPCRVSIIANARTEEFFQGITSLSKSCAVIEKEIPLRGVTGVYPLETEAKEPVNMNAEEFRKVVIRDMTQLIARSWWMTVEGDRSDYFMKKIGQFFTSENKCMIVYAIKIHLPKTSSSFTAISQTDIDSALVQYKKSEMFDKVFENDQSIQDYIALSGKGGAVLVTEPISVKSGQKEALYGIAVGFTDTSGLSKTIENIFSSSSAKINAGSSFILIAPFETLGGLCDHENK
ncbi:hypothetical protein JW756_02180 [Candidatus Woesearchaeota archaeon]|nr:hypothetical protein [Candidatus Woesearchaeota archaeon]